MVENRIPDSELVLNADGSIYHLSLHPDEIGELIITAGDPDRVAEISKYFDRVDVARQKREFVTHTGELNGHRITAISTGIGTDNIDIVLNELDALVNIDLQSRTIKPKHTSLSIVRLGTSGGLQPDIPVDSVVLSTHGLGLDNMLHFYAREEAVEQQAMQQAFVQQMELSSHPIHPYIVPGSDQLLAKFDAAFNRGITVTCSGFYGPQGRQLRLAPRFNHLLDKLPQYKYDTHRITNFEMETSGIYGLGALLGHECLSINTIIANRATKAFSKNPKKAVARMIEQALSVLTA